MLGFVRHIVLPEDNQNILEYQISINKLLGGKSGCVIQKYCYYLLMDRYTLLICCHLYYGRLVSENIAINIVSVDCAGEC